MESELKNFWQDKHLCNEDLFLAASSGPYQVEQLKIGNLIKPNDKILNIGVGRGYCTKYWHDYGCKVSVLDITPEAINKVKDFIESGFLDSDLHEFPENMFDYALSLLVIQHIKRTKKAYVLCNKIIKNNWYIYVSICIHSCRIIRNI